jgi:hypothetical protein
MLSAWRRKPALLLFISISAVPDTSLDEAATVGRHEDELEGPRSVSLRGPSIVEVGYIRQFLDLDAT